MFANGRELNQRRIPFGKFIIKLLTLSIIQTLDFTYFSSILCFQVSVIQDNNIPAPFMVIFSDSWISFAKNYDQQY